jgi:hypothetical protein
MPLIKVSPILAAMKSPDKSAVLPLEYAAELAFELHLLRGECGDMAREIVNQETLDDGALEECARLEDALAKAYRILSGTIKEIKALRESRSRPEK